MQKIIVSTAKPFHLSQAGHDMEKEVAGRGGGINLVGQGFEVYATLFRLPVLTDIQQAFCWHA